MKVYVAQPIQPEAIKILEQVALVRSNPEGRPQTRQEFLAEISDVEAVILPWHTDVMDREAIGLAPRLQVIGRHGVGYDNIDLQAATERGVYVTFTPVLAPTMADTTFALLISAARRIAEADQFVKSGGWTIGGEWVPWKFMGVDMHHKTLGIIGCGRIGGGVARRAKGFEMRILYFDEVPQPDVERETGAVRVDLEHLLREADLISVTCSLNEKTRGLIGKQQFAMMKPTAVLVNTARGGIVDEAALAEAIKGGRIGGAGLDVIVDEPLQANHPLAGLPNVILTPHMAGVTEEAMMRMAQNAAEDVVRVLRGERPKYPVNPDVFTRRGM